MVGKMCGKFLARQSQRSAGQGGWSFKPNTSVLLLVWEQRPGQARVPAQENPPAPACDGSRNPDPLGQGKGEQGAQREKKREISFAILPWQKIPICGGADSLMRALRRKVSNSR